MLKSKEISEDEEKKFEKVVQKFTDDHIKKIDDKVKNLIQKLLTEKSILNKNAF